MKFKKENVITIDNIENAKIFYDYYYANSIEKLKEIVENDNRKYLGFLSAKCINDENAFCMNIGEEGEYVIDWSIFTFYKFLYPYN